MTRPPTAARGGERMAELPVRRVAVLPDGREFAEPFVYRAYGLDWFRDVEPAGHRLARIFYTTNTGREIVVKALYR